MAEYLVKDTSLTAVADAIRAKTGNSDSLKFPDDFVSEIVGITQSEVELTLQTKTVIPTTSSQEVTADSGYDGLSMVTVTGDSNLVSDNIKSGISIFGVDGSYESDGGSNNIDLKGLVEKTITTIELPSDLTSIGEYAFYKCTQLANISIPSGVTSIGHQAFYRCLKLELASLPSSLTSIGQSAFYSTKLALTSLPDGLTSIGAYAFQSCTNLAITSIPSSVTTINSYAFSGCSSLTSITFEGTPTSIAENSFNSCTNLATINVPWAEGAVANAPWGATNATINYGYTGE